jgi:hypothetical protein
MKHVKSGITVGNHECEGAIIGLIKVTKKLWKIENLAK